MIEDFSNIKSKAEFIELLNEIERVAVKEPEGSILALFDATNAHYSSESLTYLKDVTKRVDRYMKSTSVVGIKGMLVIALRSVSKFVNRKYNLAKTREAAMDWLIEQ
ncbi:MAG: hypothetical protein JEZ00_10370 [Anaerolineaceae bacterium]|nr:hypothetical protein [Anaerolineaceae bacterium]